MFGHRREIDGLRALAVVPVILFHAGFEAFSGGFVGVDVFFVISGYLITSIILEQKALGTFSLLDFYERRARRILPALFLIMAVSIPFAWLWLMPSDMKDFSQSLVAVSVFASNILFSQEIGYFNTAAELKPLLHTWSLAVEEQYYVLFPLFMLVMWRFAKRLTVATLVVITALSFALAQWGAYNKPAATFFLLPSRGWEIAIGALVAFYFARYQKLQLQKPLQEAFSLIGLTLILYAVFAYSKATPFPSAYALVPTLGTALIILCTTPSTIVGRILASKGFVGV
jgi:peptidoglycan/LPS O-acetylase OafA/YrhL